MKIIHKPKAPPPISTTRVAARHQRVAAGVIAGKSVTAIAGEEEISRAWASKQAHSSEVAQIITSLVNSDLVCLHGLFLRAREVIKDSFTAERFAVSKDGVRISLGPDHYARLTGARRLLEFVTAGRAVPKAEDTSKRRITLEDIKRAIEQEKQMEASECSTEAEDDLL